MTRRPGADPAPHGKAFTRYRLCGAKGSSCTGEEMYTAYHVKNRKQDPCVYHVCEVHTGLFLPVINSFQLSVFCLYSNLILIFVFLPAFSLLRPLSSASCPEMLF